MARGRLEGLELPEDSVAAVDGVVEFIRGRIKTLGRLAAGPVDDRVDILDRIGIAHTDHPNVTLTDFAGAFELGAQLRGGDVFGADNAGGALVILLVAALAHIDMAAEKVFVERVGPLVHR